MENLPLPLRARRTLPLPVSLFLRKAAAVLIFPLVAWAVSACNGTSGTEPSVTGGTPGFGGGNGSGHTLWVNDDATLPVPPGTGCGNPGYRTIQSAVNDAVPGDKIRVCQGTYPEQVRIGPGKDNIQLISVGRWQAIIKAPPVMTPDAGDTRFSIVRVTTSQNVTILGFTITGPGPGPCESLHYGVRVDQSGSSKILGNHITKIRDNPFSACQNGVAVLIGRQGPGSGQVLGNVIDDYQKNGPTVNLAGSNAEISYNRVIGHGATELESQNGIQVSNGATATLRHNFVAQNIAALGTGAGTGVFFFLPGQVISEHNTITSNDFGIYSAATPSGSTINETRVRSSTLDGVVFDETSGIQVTHSESEHNALTGFFLTNGSASNTFNKVQIKSNHDSGLLLDNGNNNVVTAAKVHDNGNTDNGPDLTDGIRINLGAGNNIFSNHLRHNVTHDCHDNSYPSNTWTDNKAGTSFPQVICGDDEDDQLEDDSKFGWDANYAWYTTLPDVPDAATFDWAAGYAEFDLDSILALLPTINIGLVTRPNPIPCKE